MGNFGMGMKQEGEAMLLRIKSPRYPADICFGVERTEKGWRFTESPFNGESDPSGDPHLFRNLWACHLPFPDDLGAYVAWLWTNVEQENMPPEILQRHLNVVGRIIAQAAMT